MLIQTSPCRNGDLPHGAYPSIYLPDEVVPLHLYHTAATK